MRFILRTLIAALSFSVVLPALGQDYPNRPVKVIVPYPAGGGLDMMCRTILEKVGGALGQPFVVENRGGGSGTIGATAVA